MPRFDITFVCLFSCSILVVASAQSLLIEQHFVLLPFDKMFGAEVYFRWHKHFHIRTHAHANMTFDSLKLPN